MVVIADYGAGNIKSVEKAIQFLGEEVVTSSHYNTILNAKKLILPGVGSFGSAMDALCSSGLIPAIAEVIERGTPFLGICLGYQMLFSGSEEDGGVPGLGILEGEVKRFPSAEGFTVPQIGWNNLELKKPGTLKALGEDTFVYFVHSYYVDCRDKDLVAATTDYILEYDSAVERDNLLGCQFHPEKSGRTGLKILKAFLEK